MVLQGVYISAENPGEMNYINVDFIELQSVQTGKKRKLRQMQQELISLDTMSVNTALTSPPSPLLPQEIVSSVPSYKSAIHYNKKEKAGYTFIEITGCFREYFFMLYGMAHYVCDIQAHNDLQQSAELRELLFTTLVQVSTLYEKISTDKETSKSDILQFVTVVKGFMIETHARFVASNQTLPEYLKIDSTIPLPSSIYNYYINI